MALSLRSDSDGVSHVVYDLTIDRYFQVATLTLLAYDIGARIATHENSQTLTDPEVITMDKEVKYFWNKPLNAVHVVYFANRYVGLLGVFSSLFGSAIGVGLAQCNFAQWTWTLADWMIVVLNDYILMIRVLALYSQDRALSVCLKVLLALEACIKLATILYLSFASKFAVFALEKDLNVCGSDNSLSWSWGLVDWLIPMVYGVILMILALYKAAEYWKMAYSLRGFTLVKVLVEDQCIYFIFAISCCIINILNLRISVSDTFLAYALEGFGNAAFLSVLGSRMLVNLKEMGEKGLNQGTSCRISDINFA